MKIAIRADATRDIGGGHVMRSLVIARELYQRNHDVSFFAVRNSFSLVPIALSGVNGIEIDAGQFDDPSIIPEGFDLILIDSYRLGIEYEIALQKRCSQLAVLDDIPARKHCANILIDPTFGREAEEYRSSSLVPDHCKLLTGVEYAPLRADFSDLRSKKTDLSKRVTHNPPEIIVSLGLTDPENDTLKVVRDLLRLQMPFNTNIVLGKESNQKQEIERLISQQAEIGPGKFSCLEAVEDMASLMAACDIAIGAGGSTCWERCCLGLPSIILVQADNQRDITAKLSNLGAIICLGDSKNLEPGAVASVLQELLEDPDKMAALGSTAAAICDGKGALRIADALEAAVRSGAG